MKPRRERSKRMRIMHLWSWSEVAKAVPYLGSVIGSLREHWLDVLNAQRKIDKESARPGRASRQQIIDMQADQDERHQAQTRFDDALQELNKVDVFLFDPIRGLALIPFRKGDELAWYIFDHFTPRGVIGWRLQNDPIDECRPLELTDESAVKNPVAS